MAANLSCHDFETLIGMNSICKTRWTNQWQGGGTQQTLMNVSSDSPPPPVLSLDDQNRLQDPQANSVMTIDHQQLQHWQILSHLQVNYMYTYSIHTNTYPHINTNKSTYMSPCIVKFICSYRIFIVNFGM